VTRTLGGVRGSPRQIIWRGGLLDYPLAVSSVSVGFISSSHILYGRNHILFFLQQYHSFSVIPLVFYSPLAHK